MSLTTRIRLLALASATAAAMMLTGCGGGGGGGGDDSAGGTTGSTTGGSMTGGDTGGMTGGGAAGTPVYVSLDGGGDIGTVDAYSANLSSRIASFNTGLNEGIAFGRSTLSTIGLIGGVATLRDIPDFVSRGSGAFNAATDNEFQFPEIRAPHGIAYVGLTGQQLVVADAPIAVDGEDPVSVPSLHVVSTALGLTTPRLVVTVPVSAAFGRTWDVAYDIWNDRLYGAMTNGSIAVYDRFLSRATFSIPFGPDGRLVTRSRIITPGAVNGGNSSKISVNLHGISYNITTDQLVVSDVGSADGNSDGALYLIDNASTVNDATVGSGPAIVVPSRMIKGSATLLGNPVDVLLRSDGTLYVAEKLNGGGQILVFNSFLSGSSGNIAPNLHVTTASLGSRGTPESITEAE